MRPLIACLIVLLSAIPAAAKSYFVERFDSRIRVIEGGAIEVTEVAVFRFDDGTFTHVYRELPKRRTDGIEIVSATMDGRQMGFGEAPDQVELQRGERLKIRWRFAPRSGTTHTFTLTYIVRGVVQKAGGADMLEWIALPTNHDYRIGTSDVVVEAPAALLRPPRIEVSRVGEHSVEPSASRVQIVARDIGKNGWVKAHLEFPDGALIATAPRWQLRREHANALAPQWLTAAGLILAVGIVLLFAMYQRYDRPPSGSPVVMRTVDAPPDDLRPALAGAVAANGSVSLTHAMATLFALADRGAVSVDEEPRTWGQRRFTIHRRQAPAHLTPEDEALLDIAFAGERSADGVALTKVRSRIHSGLRKYRDTVRDELRKLGLHDDDRARVRGSFGRLGGALLVIALVLIVPAAVLTSQFAGWGFLVPAAVGVVAATAFILYGALTPLTNDGVRRGAEWRAYRRHLRDVARDRAALAARSPATLLPFAVALGLAGQWSKFVKHRPAAVPPWFRTLAGGDDGAFPAFVAFGGAADGGGAGGAGGGGGAAGGGGSGAG